MSDLFLQSLYISDILRGNIGISVIKFKVALYISDSILFSMNVLSKEFNLLDKSYKSMIGFSELNLDEVMFYWFMGVKSMISTTGCSILCMECRDSFEISSISTILFFRDDCQPFLLTALIPRDEKWLEILRDMEWLFIL